MLGHSKGGRVLAVLQSPLQAKLVVDILGRSGFKVQTAASALEGVQQALRNAPDLVVVDWQLTDLHGLELLFVLRSEPRLAGVPVILLSARSAVYDVEAFLGCFSIRPDACLAKPFAPARLLELAQSLTASPGDESPSGLYDGGTGV